MERFIGHLHREFSFSSLLFFFHFRFGMCHGWHGIRLPSLAFRLDVTVWKRFASFGRLEVPKKTKQNQKLVRRVYGNSESIRLPELDWELKMQSRFGRLDDYQTALDRTRKAGGQELTEKSCNDSRGNDTMG
jgi:hypothetical protein